MEQIIQVKQGKLQGTPGKFSCIYRGVPYAKPPTGKLRFHAPEPAEAWPGIYQADHFACICPQPGQRKGSFYEKEFYCNPQFMPKQSEDCLYLNLWVPKEGEGPFPVAVWFHGGGFINGFSSEMEFDGEAYAKRGIILVTVNYRLGTLGYFAHPELRERDGHTGNYGLLDQIAAVDWVRENISAFGGNPDQITIFGQSAGGMSVRALVSSPLMKGKIKGAILQSCGGYRSPLSGVGSREGLEKAAVKFLKKRKMSLKDLYDLPEKEFFAFSMKFMSTAIFYTHSFLPLTPVVDDYALIKSPDQVLEDGEILPISYMIGCTKNDIRVGKAGVENPRKNRLYTSMEDWSLMQEKLGNPSYAYYFTRQLPGDREGAFHSSELWYMFGTMDRCWRPFTDQDYQLSEKMLDAWAAFIKKGNPGWASYTKANPVVRVLDVE